MLFSTLGPSSLPIVVAQPDERHAKRTASVLEWYDRHRAYTTSGSTEEDLGCWDVKNIINQTNLHCSLATLQRRFLLDATDCCCETTTALELQITIRYCWLVSLTIFFKYISATKAIQKKINI